AASAVVLVMVSSLTLLPAMLGFSGRAIDRLRVPRLLHRHDDTPRETWWHRWSRVVQRRAWLTGSVALVVLLVLALPLLWMRLTFPDAGNDPPGTTTRHAYDLIARGFGPGANGPLVVAVDVNGSDASVTRLAQRIAKTDGVQSVAPPILNDNGDAAVILVT